LAARRAANEAVSLFMKKYKYLNTTVSYEIETFTGGKNEGGRRPTASLIV
jgi:hypothetical protein